VWETTVRVEVSSVVDAAPERAWPLLRSPEAWSARPVSCLMFDIPAADAGRTLAPDSDPGQLRFYLGAAKGRAAAMVLLVADEVPGETICLRTSDGRATWQLSVERVRRGMKLRIAAAFVVPRPSKVDVESGQRETFQEWLKRLRASAEGRAPWPGDGAADRVRQACAAGVSSAEAVECSVSVDVNAPPASVSRALQGAPEYRRAILGETVLYSGHVPGTPSGQVGAFTYYVHRRSDGSLLGMSSMLAASAPGAIIVRYVTPPFAETTYRWEPAGAGTLLQMTFRCPGQCTGGPDAHREVHATMLAATASRIKAAIESLPEPTSSLRW
jgi:hypothetical protein